MKQNSGLRMNAGVIREKTDVELQKLAGDMQEELFRLRFRKGGGQLKQTSNIRHAKRMLARVKTVVRERELKSAKGEG